MKNKRVFISYARKDGSEFAKKLRQDLEKQKIPCWQDRQGMEGGRDWWEQIKEALDYVEYMVLVITPAAIQSPIIRKEWRYARAQGVCVYPVKGVPDKDIDYKSLPKPIRDSHFYDIEEEREKFINDLNTRCTQERVPFMAKDKPDDFVNRPDEFDKIKKQLIDAGKGEPIAITAALKGSGGFGKTTMATALCHDEDILEFFDDGILWVTLGEKVENLQGKVEDLVFELEHNRPGFSSLDAAASYLGRLLTDKDILLVVDDVWHAGDARPFLEGGNKAARLITTRNSDTLPAKCREINLDKMEKDEAVALLTYDLPVEPAQYEEFRKLARKLGLWPLLLKLVNAALRDRLKKADSLTNALTWVNKALTKKGLTFFDVADEQERNSAVKTTMQVSLDLLTDDENIFFSELAIFPEDIAIPLAMVEQLWADHGYDEFDTEELCRKLHNYSLLLDFSLADRTIRLHDVIRSFLREKTKDDLIEINKRFTGNIGEKAWPAKIGYNDYLWRHLAYHYSEAARKDELKSLLFNFNWLMLKTEQKDLNSLLNDFDYLDDEEGELLQSALRLSSNQLLSDPAQLAAHLYGRLQLFENECFKELLNHARKQAREKALLFPKRQTLTPPGGPLIRTLLGHTGWVNHVALTADGGRAVSASSDNSLRVWDVASGRCLHTLEGHTGLVRHVALTADGGRAVSASDDHSIIVWDLNTFKILKRFIGESPMTSVAINNSTIIAGEASGHVHVLEFK